jgi:hypothetical protein
MSEILIRHVISCDPAVADLIRDLADALRAGRGVAPAAAGENLAAGDDLPRENSGLLTKARDGKPADAAGVVSDVSSLTRPSAPQAPEGVFLPKSGGRIWTDERKDWLRANFIAGVSYDTLIDGLNRFPGLPITSMKAVKNACFKFKIKRRVPVLPSVVQQVTIPAGAVWPIAAPPDLSVLAEKFNTKFRQDAKKLDPNGVMTVTKPQARAWAAERGLCNGVDGVLDLAAVNAKRVQLGMPKFEIAGGRP